MGQKFVVIHEARDGQNILIRSGILKRDQFNPEISSISVHFEILLFIKSKSGTEPVKTPPRKNTIKYLFIPAINSVWKESKTTQTMARTALKIKPPIKLIMILLHQGLGPLKV